MSNSSQTSKFYYTENGILSRLDGPAYINLDGTELWYIDGERINVSSNEEFLRYVRLMSFI